MLFRSSYDFQAPIREYGQISESYKEIKLLAMFLHDFGESLCDMPAHIPNENPQDPSDFKRLRWSVRYKKDSGYLFVNNYIRNYTMSNHTKHTFRIQTDTRTIEFVANEIKDKEYYFWPIRIPIKGGNLTATASPLCMLNKNTQEEQIVQIGRAHV